MTDLAHIFVIAAPSGAGKTSLVNEVLQRESKLQLSVSFTTREPRPKDVHGKDYHFIDEMRFQEMIEQNDFLEHAHVYGHYYGTSRAWVQQQLEQGRDIILEIDWQGARQIKQHFAQHAVLIFVLPPSLQELKQRLLRREQDSALVIGKRMQVAQQEMQHCKEFDYLLVNDDFAATVSSLQAIIKSASLSMPRQLLQQQQLLQLLLADDAGASTA